MRFFELIQLGIGLLAAVSYVSALPRGCCTDVGINRCDDNREILCVRKSDGGYNAMIKKKYYDPCHGTGEIFNRLKKFCYEYIGKDGRNRSEIRTINAPDEPVCMLKSLDLNIEKYVCCPANNPIYGRKFDKQDNYECCGGTYYDVRGHMKCENEELKSTECAFQLNRCPLITNATKKGSKIHLYMGMVIEIIEDGLVLGNVRNVDYKKKRIIPKRYIGHDIIINTKCQTERNMLKKKMLVAFKGGKQKKIGRRTLKNLTLDFEKVCLVE